MNDLILQPPAMISEIDENKIYEIPMEQIYSDADFNVRGEISPSSVMELAKDIRANGLLQPITVQPFEVIPGKKFRIIAGHRRHAAHLILGTPTIRGIIKKNLRDADAVVFNLIENLHREQLNMLQEAYAVRKLKELMITQEEAARRVGKSRGWIQTRFRILDLPPEIQDEVGKGFLTASQIEEVHSLHDQEAQYEFVRRIKDAKLFGRDPDKVKKPKVEAASTKKIRTREEIFEIQDTIRETLGNSLTTVILGWVAGEVDNYDLHMSIAEEARKAGIFYQVPENLTPSHDPEMLAHESEEEESSEPPIEEEEFEPMEGEVQT